jgi:hypothetical protein
MAAGPIVTAFLVVVGDAIDDLSLIWRWWSSFGALMALVMVRSWLWPLIPESIAYWRGQLPQTKSVFDPGSRLVLRFSILLSLAAIVLAGVIVPLGADNRIESFNPSDLSYRATMALAWLLFGSSAWSIVIGFSVRKWPTVIGCILLWFAVHASLGMGL